MSNAHTGLGANMTRSGSSVVDALRSTGLTRVAARYVAVGASLNLTSVAIFAWLWSMDVGVAPFLVNLISSALIFPLWFGLNRLWVFRSDMPLSPQIRRAVVSYGTAMAVSASLMWLLSGALGLPPILAQVFTIATMVVVSFTVNALWTFAHRREAKPVPGESP